MCTKTKVCPCVRRMLDSLTANMDERTKILIHAALAPTDTLNCRKCSREVEDLEDFAKGQGKLCVPCYNEEQRLRRKRRKQNG